MIEFDLRGQKLSVAEHDVAWLRAGAEKAAGNSSSASELAGRLAAISVGQHRLVLARAEVRAVRNVLKSAKEVPPGLSALNELMQQMFAA